MCVNSTSATASANQTAVLVAIQLLSLLLIVAVKTCWSDFGETFGRTLGVFVCVSIVWRTRTAGANLCLFLTLTLILILNLMCVHLCTRKAK